MKNLKLTARIYILGTIVLGASLFGWRILNWQAEELLMVAGLSALASLSLIIKVIGTTDRSHYNISFLVYGFALVLLGPEEAMLVILVSNLVDWAWHRYPWYIQSFNIACYFIAIIAAATSYQLLSASSSLFDVYTIASLLVGMAAFTLINHLMIGTVVWLARGETFRQSGLLDFLPLMIDFTVLCMGGGAALIWLVNPFGVVIILVPLYLIYTTLKVPALERKSETDPKTGLFNAEYFTKVVSSELERANRFDRPLTVVMADMDLLRNINNTYGHLAGDEVLTGVARIIKEASREVDTVARFGGEEFAILMPETRPQEVYQRVDELRQHIEQTDFTVQTSVMPIRVTLSFGIAGREGFDQEFKELIHNADMALYTAKLRGRNRTLIYNAEGYEELFLLSQMHEPQDTSVLELSPEATVCRETTCQTTSAELAGDPDGPVQREPEEVQAGQVGTNAQSANGRSAHARSRSRWLVSAFIAGLFLCAVALFGMTYRPMVALDWLGLTAFTAVVVLAEWLSIEIYVRDTSVSTSAAPMLAGVLLFGATGSLVLGVAFAVVALIKHRSKLSRFVFNASNQVLAGLMCVLIISFFGKEYSNWPVLVQLVGSLVGGGIVYLTTTFSVALVMHLDLGLPVRELWREKFSWLAPYYLAMGMVAFTLILSFIYASFLGMAVVLLPLLMLRLSQIQYIDRTKGMVTELKEKNLALERSAIEINYLNEGLLNALAEVIDLRDPFVSGHSRQVTMYATKVAMRLGLGSNQVEKIRKAGLLHDIGKLGVPDEILRKPARLTEEEYALVKAHVVLGAEILATSNALHDLVPIVRHHHEAYDGRGYPDGLKGEAIPIEARIVALADAVEAMASDRPYRRALSVAAIRREIQEHAGTQFDPQVARLFLEILDEEGDELLVNSARRAYIDLTQGTPITMDRLALAGKWMNGMD